MNILQILLILTALTVAGGGVLVLYRMSRSRDTDARGPYMPLGTIAIGLMVAYRAYSDYNTLDAQDILIMFLFVFALLGLLGLQFFIVDRHKAKPSAIGDNHNNGDK